MRRRVDGHSLATDNITEVRDHTTHMPSEIAPSDESGSGDGVSTKAGGYFVGVTGLEVLNVDAQEGTMTNTESVEKYTFPIAFFVLGCFVRSARMMVIPVLTICMCLGTTYSICYGVAQVLDVVTIAPALMMAATLAFNIDYNLFLLTRFRDNSNPRSVTIARIEDLEGCCELADSTSGPVVRRVPKRGPAFAVGVRKGWELLDVGGAAAATVEGVRAA
eukprot:gene5726-28710_t